MGGMAMVHLAALHPRLFHHMVLIEPMVILGLGHTTLVTLFSYATISKPDVWPSREAAEKFFRTSMPYKAWDPRVRDQMLRHGICERGGAGEVELVTSKHQEAITFARPANADFSAWEFPTIEAAVALVPFLKPPVSYVFGERSMLLPKENRVPLMSTTGSGVGGSGGAAAGMVTEAEIKNGGHTIPLDAVDECAETVACAIANSLTKSADIQKTLVQRSFKEGTSDVSEAWRAGVLKGVDIARKTRIRAIKL